MSWMMATALGNDRLMGTRVGTQVIRMGTNRKEALEGW